MPSPYEGLDDRAFWKHVPTDRMMARIHAAILGKRVGIGVV